MTVDAIPARTAGVDYDRPMTRLASVLAVLFGCGAAAEPIAQPPEPGITAPAGAPPVAAGSNAAPRPGPSGRSGPGPQPACADFAAVTGQPLDRAVRLDLDNDGLADAAVREEGCGLRCEFRLYRLARDGCWVSVGEVRDLMSEPFCEDKPAPNTWCRLSGMRLMIHGDAQEYNFSFDGARYDRDGIHGDRYVPPRTRGKSP